ncbi:TPA: hypothetical protein H2T82_004056 [Salmonella enterica]|nr:hypothetical protein [Salmonella enterica]
MSGLDHSWTADINRLAQRLQFCRVTRCVPGMFLLKFTPLSGGLRPA